MVSFFVTRFLAVVFFFGDVVRLRFVVVADVRVVVRLRAIVPLRLRAVVLLRVRVVDVRLRLVALVVRFRVVVLLRDAVAMSTFLWDDGENSGYPHTGVPLYHGIRSYL